ncbi:S8 family serine peptidase [Halobaculum limi]|uniref:S8 family serine peptidase n=1 Tax=Halobaculum limi TaxID=3031916 RepID=UPI002407287E|nr:S8 family serine peptidase [Halobaculum sp. YSMS11]
MKSLANSEQERARDLIRERRADGSASDLRTFWARNALAVSADGETIRDLAALPNVERIVYDRKVTAADGGTGVPALDRILSKYNTTTSPAGIERDASSQSAWGTEYVGADAVQDRGVTGAGVNVSVVDSGIDDTHPALQGQVTTEKDFTDENLTDLQDPDGHGTHVAATVAGRRDADQAVGVAPDANLFDARALDSQGSGRLSWILSAFEWSAENDADVISASLGLSPLTDSYTGTQTVESGSSASHDVTLYSDADSAYQNFNESGYEASYVMVIVEPVAVNGSTVNASEAAAALDNASVAFRNPNGEVALDRYSAGWAFGSGEVPDGLIFRKYKPSSGTISTTGNWSLEVQNSNDVNVTYNYTAVPVYPSNGSDELSKSVTSLAESNDVLPVIAAGNSGYVFGDRSVGSPGAAEGAITVGASEYRSQAVAPFSSRGPVGYGADKRQGVTIIAPGTDVISADAGGGYVGYSGTSMATPHVSGTIALMLDADSTMSNTEVRDTLTASAQEVPAPANAAGAGMLDAWAAVNSTNASVLSASPTNVDSRELFAGIGDTGETYVNLELDPATDPAGDASNAPDLRYTSRKIVNDEIEIALAGEGTYNGSFTVYIDADSNDSTGDLAQGGADFRAVLNRTFDGSSFSLYIDEQRYNASADAYEHADNFSVYDGTQSKQLVEMYLDIYAGPFENTGPAEYHIVSRTLDSSTDTDRFPNSGQLSENVSDRNLKALGIAWNASAGQPVSGVPITFEVMNDSGAVVANATTLTDSQGRAIHNFSVGLGYYDVRVSDDRGNSVTQPYDLSDACIEYCIVDSGFSEFPNHVAEYRDYEVEANSTVTVNVPVYSDDGNMTPYDGPASAEVGSHSGEPIVFDDLQVADGVVTFTVDLSQTSLDESDDHLDIRLALSSNFSNATEYASVGDLNIVSSEDAYTQLGPEVMTVAPGGSTTVSFQHTTYGEGPVNASADYRVTWITDRTVASLSNNLPTDTLTRLKQVRRAARTGDDSSVRLTDRDKREIREALENISTSRTATTVVTGTADPVANGVGTFTAESPIDARFGIVEAKSSTSEDYSGLSVVAIEGRSSQYYDNRTDPQEDTGQRYGLFTYDSWGSHVEGDYRVPNDTYDINVRLYDYETDSYVDNATVNVYTDGGDVYEVTTDANGYTTVTVDAPDTDWVNASFDEREQQVYAVVRNLSQPDGTAITEDEFLYPDISRASGSGGVVEPLPDIRYDDGTLRTRIDYRNDTYDPVPGQRTLVIVNQGDYESNDDVFVGFVDPGSNESITRNFTDSTPPASDEYAEYEMTTRTRSMDDNTFWVDWADAEGVSAETTVNGGFADDVSTTVTVNVTDRNGDPVEGAAVVWRYQVDTFENRSYEANVPSEMPGGVKVGTTDPDGTVTFEVTPDVPEGSADAYLDYTVGVATANTSETYVDGGYEQVERDLNLINASGRLKYADGSNVSGQTIETFGDNFRENEVQTNEDGTYTLKVEPNSTGYELAYKQTDFSDTTPNFPKDGRADLYAFTEFDTNGSDVDLGTRTVPEGHLINITVVDSNGNPVSVSDIDVMPVNGDATGHHPGYTNADGEVVLEYADSPGVEANGTLQIRIPATGPYLETVKEFDVQNRTNATIVLNEETTISGQLVDERGDGLSGDFAVVNGPGVFDPTETNATGNFSTVVPGNATYRIGYVQQNDSTSVFFPRDGVTDLYVPTNVTVGSGSVSVGTETIPDAAGVLDVRVVDESGNPVHDANVTINPTTIESATLGFIANTSEQGYYTIGGKRGLEANGSYLIEVEPGNATGYVDETRTRNVTVTNDTTVRVQLNTTETAGIDVDYTLESTEVETGSPVNVTATVTNNGNTTDTETVRLFVDEEVVANETVTVAAGDTETVTFSRTLDRGTHKVRVNALSGTRVTVSNRVSTTFEPSTVRVNTGDERTVNLTLANATNGVGALDVTLSLANVSTARITGVTVVPDGGSTNVDIASDGGSARVTAALLDTNDTGSVPLLRVTVAGGTNGSTTLTATPNEISDEPGLPYIVDANATTTVQVGDVPPIGNNSARPTDVDGDSKLEDVNGDGEFTVSDVQTLWKHYKNDAVQSNAGAFDFNGDGEVNVVDVQKLFAALNGGDN